jgi:acetyl esterase/lipase
VPISGWIISLDLLADFRTRVSAAHKLMAAGVSVRATRYLGTIHDFLLLNPLAQTPPAQAALAQVIGTLRTVFAHKTSSESNP